jgi:hypothetical protein
MLEPVCQKLIGRGQMSSAIENYEEVPFFYRISSGATIIEPLNRPATRRFAARTGRGNLLDARRTAATVF